MPINKTGIYKDKKPQYLVRVNYTDSYGKYKQVERTVYGKAEAEERKLCFELKDKQVPLISRMTVEQLIIEYDSYHKQTTKKTSHITTMKTLELRVKPFLGNVRLDKLTQSVLLDWQKEIYQQKLAHSTRCNAYSALMGLLNYALKKEYILKNPLKPLGPFKDVNNGIKKKRNFTQ